MPQQISHSRCLSLTFGKKLAVHLVKISNQLQFFKRGGKDSILTEAGQYTRQEDPTDAGHRETEKQ